MRGREAGQGFGVPFGVLSYPAGRIVKLAIFFANCTGSSIGDGVRRRYTIP